MSGKKRFRFFRGKPVKRMRQDGEHIVLNFVSAVPGKQGRVLRVTQQQWNDHGEWREVESTRMADIRELVPR